MKRVLTILLLIACSCLDVHAALPDGAVDALRARAASEGEVRVIVQLQAPWARLGDLTPSARKSRLQNLANLQALLSSQLRQPGLRELARFRTIPFMVFSADAAAIDRLAGLPLVASIQEDVPEAPALASSVPIIGAPAVWNLGHQGTGQTIAILDTGVDSGHAFFSGGKVVAEACFSTNQGLVEGRYSASLCPGGVSSSTAPGSGQPCANSVSPSCTHGTHVAGIAAGNDGVGPNIGVAKGASLISIQVFSCSSSVEGCAGVRSLGAFVSDQILALEHVLALSETIDIAAVNMSLGGTLYSNQASCDSANEARKAAIDNLRSVGIPTIISSGNNSSKASISQPGCISSAISVGNTTDADSIASNSNVSLFLDLLAPGSQIDSAAPGGGVVSNSGTSMSAPHVSGAWAIIRGVAPAATVDQILQVLRSTGVSVDDQRSGGVVDDMRRIRLDLAVQWFLVPKPALQINPASGSTLDLGDVTVAATGVPLNVPVTNSGNADLTLQCQISGAQASSFHVAQCPSPMVSAASANIALRCDPQAVGELASVLTINTNDETVPVLNFNLVCTGLGAEISTSPVAGAALNFGNVLVDTLSAAQNVQVSNSGNQALGLTCALTGTHPDQFVMNSCPATVAAAAQGQVSVRCQPDSLGAKSANLEISSNDADEALLSFSLGCTGTAPEFSAVPAPDSLLDFGEVFVAQSSAVTEIQVSNTGTAPLHLECDLQGTNAISFQVVQCPASIAAQQTVAVQLVCSPVFTGNKVAQLLISSDDEDEPESQFDLACLGKPKQGTIFSDSFEQ